MRTPYNNKQENILVLDDEPAIVEEISETLSEAGYTVFPATHSIELWNSIETNQIDLFIIDLMLPGDNGLTIVQKLRNMTQAGIIIVTGKAEETDRVVGLEIGADDYVIKPFSARELLARVRSVLRRINTQSGEQSEISEQQDLLEFCGWQLFLGRYELLTPKGNIKHLTTAEFDLLKTFLEYPNHVLSRDFLLDHVHGREWNALDRGIDGLISRLRKKIVLEDGSVLIKTVRNVGYLFTQQVTKRKSE